MTATSTAQEFRAFLDTEWSRCLADWPELATAVGHPGFDDRWTDYRPEAIAEREAHLRSTRSGLDRFHRGDLPPTEQLNYDLFREGLEDAEAGLAFGFEPFPFHLGSPSNLWMPVSQLAGVHVDPAILLDLQPRGSAEEVEHLLGRLEGLPSLVEQTLALLRRGLARGFSPPRITLRGVVGQVRGLVPTDPLASSLLRPLQRLPSSVSPAAASGYLERARSLYTERLAPAYRTLEQYLGETYVPSAREPTASSALPSGAAAYEFLVRVHTTTRQTPEAIHAVGLAEVERISREMEAVRARAGFPGDLAAFKEHLRTDPSFRPASAEALVDGYRVLAKKIEPELPHLFGRLPRLPYGIVPVPDFSAPSAPAAFYISGSPEAGRAGYFFVNTFSLESRPRWEMEDLFLHEAVPGHHLQTALAAEVEGLPAFRKHTGATAYAEGWGLYAEGLGEELGCYRDPRSKFGQLVGEIWRAVRLVVDTGLHALGWSREKAIRYFQETTGRSEHEATVEVDRYLVWPGQALAYKTGELKFRELRERARAALGPRFDIRRFHDTLLAQGALPLTLVEREVESWIATTRPPG